MTNDPDVIGPLLWLRQREIVHYARFKELFEEYEKKLTKGQNEPNQNNWQNKATPNNWNETSQFYLLDQFMK